MSVRLLVQDAELIEDRGEYVGAVQMVMAYVTGGGTPIEIIQDALDEAGMPQTGQSLSAEYPRLCVISRRGKVVGKKRGAGHLVRVRIEYALDAPTLGYPIRGGASVAQIITPKDKNGNPISYTYKGVTKYRKVSVFAAEAFEVRKTVELTNKPEEVARKYINKVNSDTWCGAGPGKWLCTKAEYTLLNAATAPDRWEFTWEFHKSAEPNGWKRYVWYEDSNGNIPDDIDTEGEGFKEVEWHDEIAFSDKFPPAETET